MHGPPTGFTNSNSTIFRQVTNLKLQFLTYSCRFIYLTFTNTSKHGQNDEIRHSSFRSSKPHEVKSTDMRCILTTNINICRGENTTRRKKCQIFASAMYSSYQAGISPEGGLEVGQTLWFFQERFARKLIYSGAKWRLRKCIWNLIHDKKIFALSRSATC